MALVRSVSVTPLVLGGISVSTIAEAIEKFRIGRKHPVVRHPARLTIGFNQLAGCDVYEYPRIDCALKQQPQTKLRLARVPEAALHRAIEIKQQTCGFRMLRVPAAGQRGRV